MRWVWHYALTGDKRGVCRVSLGSPEGRRPPGTPRCRWKDINVDLQEVGWRCMDWIDLAEGRDRWRAFVKAVVNFRFHKGRGIS